MKFARRSFVGAALVAAAAFALPVSAQVQERALAAQRVQRLLHGGEGAELLVTVGRALEANRLQQENLSLRRRTEVVAQPVQRRARSSAAPVPPARCAIFS